MKNIFIYIIPLLLSNLLQAQTMNDTVSNRGKVFFVLDNDSLKNSFSASLDNRVIPSVLKAKQGFAASTLYHYKYTQKETIDVFVEKRSYRTIFNLSDSYKWDLNSDNIIIVVKDINNYLKNETYKIHRQNLTPSARMDYRLKNNRYFVELVALGSPKPGYKYYGIVDIELFADEYKSGIEETNYFSDVFETEGINFSVILPLKTITNGRNIETTAVLTLIINGVVHAIDPYSFTEDNKLKKLNTLAYGEDKVEFLFQLK